MNKGFTLIEMVLVIALLGLTVGVASDIILSLTRSYAKTQIANEVEQNANYISSKLEKELRTAKRVIAINTSPPSIEFTDRNNQDVTYTVNNNIVNRLLKDASGSVTIDNSDISNDDTINGVNVTCNGQCFTQILSNPTTIYVSLNFKNTTRNNVSNAFTNSLDIKTTIVVRDTY